MENAFTERNFVIHHFLKRLLSFFVKSAQLYDKIYDKIPKIVYMILMKYITSGMPAMIAELFPSSRSTVHIVLLFQIQLYQ